MCAPQIFRVPPDPSSDRKIRVIENLYPALDRNLKDADFDFGGGGGCSGDTDVLRGVEFHDVVIETLDHLMHLSDLSPREVGDVILTYKKRIEQLWTFDSIKYLQVFKNHGCLLKLMLRKIDPPFSFLIQTSPVHTSGSQLGSTNYIKIRLQIPFPSIK
ncbi:hypothetical protein ACJRO7_016866 [Eucalyptus globulus]|uniref:Uncharacterized protein n=1 Tax=Eucalyptus globulus TaxID=34317 RepID=A0ABD3KN80_EUCGL